MPDLRRALPAAAELLAVPGVGAERLRGLAAVSGRVARPAVRDDRR